MYQFKTYEEAYNAASEYFKTKQRRKMYHVDCWADGDDLITDAGFEACWTDEEVAEIKELMVEYHNKYALAEGDAPITRYEDADIGEIPFNAPKMEELIYNRCGEIIGPYCDGFYINKIHFEEYYCTYGFVFRAYDPEYLEMYNPKKLGIQLSDEEYVYLLAMRLLHGKHFTFMRLFKEKPELATKFCQQVDAYASEGIGGREMPMPYMIQLSEIDEDAFAIAGPDEVWQTIMQRSRPVLFDVCAFTSGRELTIRKQTLVEENNNPKYNDLSYLTASADEVMKLLGKPTYALMADELCRRFKKKASAFEDIRDFFAKEGVEFRERQEREDF